MTDSRQIRVSCQEGGEVVITFPYEPLTPDTLDLVEELCELWLRGLRRRTADLSSDVLQREFARVNALKVKP